MKFWVDIDNSGLGKFDKSKSAKFYFDPKRTFKILGFNKIPIPTSSFLES